MTERRWPVKIYITWEHFGDSAPGRSFSASDQVYPDYPVFIRADIAERMAEALDRALSLLSDHHDDPAAEDGWENEEIRDAWMGGQAALSAFRSATQDTGARHD